MTNSNINNRLEFIDICKGIGIFLVISSHTYGSFMSWALPFYIPIFFVTSGFCTIRPIKLKVKYKKLIIPYFFFSFILLAINKSINLIDIVGVLYSRWSIYPLACDNNIYLLRSGNGPLWFLTSMYSSYTFYWIAQKSCKPFLFVFFSIVITYLLSFLPILLPWSIDTASLMVLFIYFGVIIREKRLLPMVDLKWLCWLAILYFAFLHFCGNINLSVRIYGRSLIVMLPAAMLGSFLLMRVSCYIENTIIGNIISMIGRHSLSIFCLHIPFIAVWETIVDCLQINIPPVIYGILCIIFVLLITYPISLFLDKYVLNYITK